VTAALKDLSVEQLIKLAKISHTVCEFRISHDLTKFSI